MTLRSFLDRKYYGKSTAQLLVSVIGPLSMAGMFYFSTNLGKVLSISIGCAIMMFMFFHTTETVPKKKAFALILILVILLVVGYFIVNVLAAANRH